MHKQQTHQMVWHTLIAGIEEGVSPNLGISNCAIQCKMHKQQIHQMVWHTLIAVIEERGILILVYLTVPYCARCTNNRLMRWSDILLLQVLKKGYPNLGISNRAIQCKMHKQQIHEMVWHTLIAGIEEGVSKFGISNRAIQCKMHKQQTHEMVWHTLIAGIEEGVS